jgi:prepilin-type N-terminal cleavage/methylation domain-containing protein
MKQKSFTLIELMVAVTIFVIVVAIGLATVVTLTHNRTKSETNTSLQTSGNLAMETIVNAVQNATSLLTQPSGSTLTIEAKTFSLSGDAITLAISGGAAERLTSPNVKVTELTFTGAADSATPPAIKGYVTINMKLQSIDPSDNETLTLHTTATYLSP